MSLGQPLGSVIQGSLTGGLEVRLHPNISVEDMRVGKFLVVQGMRSRFFCMLTDVALGTANQRILANPPSWEDTFARSFSWKWYLWNHYSGAHAHVYARISRRSFSHCKWQTSEFICTFNSARRRATSVFCNEFGFISAANKHYNGIDASQNYSQSF